MHAQRKLMVFAAALVAGGTPGARAQDVLFSHDYGGESEDGAFAIEATRDGQEFFDHTPHAFGGSQETPPIRVRTREVLDIAGDIAGIELVDQSDMIVSYRPRYCPNRFFCPNIPWLSKWPRASSTLAKIFVAALSSRVPQVVAFATK